MQILQVDKLKLNLFAAVEDGMQLELVVDSDDPEMREHIPYPMVTVRADSKNVKQFVIHFEDVSISVPLSEIERALEIAKKEVHPEEYYD